MISIVTGTLNRVGYLPDLIKNTVDSSELLELILVDGGSDDGTIEYLENLNHPRIKLIKYGKRSNYPHYMNLGILNAKFDWVCQWNDDVILINDWNEIIQQIENSDDEMLIFNWKYGNFLEDIKNASWLYGTENNQGWFLCDTKQKNGMNGDIVLNFGLYHKKVFEKIGLYDMKFKYYYADADMAERAWFTGCKYKALKNIKVFSYDIPKKALSFGDDEIKFKNNLDLYKQKIIPKTVPFLKDNKAIFHE